MNFSNLKKNKLVKQLVGYTGLNFLEKSIPFIVLPILTNVLSKEDIGFFVLYLTLFEILLPIMTVSVANTLLINFYKLEFDKFKNYFSNGLFLFSVIYLLVFFVLFVTRETISEFTKFPENPFLLVLAIVFFAFLTQNRQNLWRLQYKVKNYGFYTIGMAILKNGTGLLLVLYYNLGWTGMILGHLIGYFVFGILAIYTFLKEKLLIFKIDQTYLRDLIKVGYPISIHRIGIWLGSAANKIIIATILGANATGSYGVGAVFAAIVVVLEDAISKGVVPYIYEKLKNNFNKKKIVKLSYFVYLALIVSSICVYVVGYFALTIIFGNEYIDSKDLILPLILAAMIKGFYKLHVSYIHFTKKTQEVMKITLFTGILNLFLSYFLISNYNLMGAAYSLIIINSIQYILSFYVANKLIPMPWFYIFKKNNKANENFS